MNKGERNEQMFGKRFNIEINDIPNKKFNEGSDTMNGISLKSFRFSVPATIKITERTEENFKLLINDHLRNSHSRCYCITIRNKYYFMSKRLFGKAIEKFGYFDNDSKANGGKIKIRCGSTLKMAKWLTLQGINGIE